MHFLEFYEDVVALDTQWIASRFCDRRMRGLAGGQIEFPLVPGADDLSVFNSAFGERAAAMRADIIQRQRNSLQHGHTQGVTLNRKFFSFRFGRQVLPTT